MFPSALLAMGPLSAAYRAIQGGLSKSAEADPAPEPARQEDVLSLSSPTRLVEKLLGVAPRADGSIGLDDIRQAHEARMSRFSDSVSRLLFEAGVDRSQTATLQSDPLGQVRVTNDHPDKEKIESLFAENPELANEFRYLSATASFLQAAETHRPFATAHAKDPNAAVQQYAQLFDESRRWLFQLHVGDGNMKPEVVTR